MTIRLALGHVDHYDNAIRDYALQLGLTSVQLHCPSNLSTPDGFWRFDELKALRERCERDGLRLEGLENVPAKEFYKIQRGLQGRDEQIENFQRTIRNMAAAGIDLLGYNFLATYVWRTDMEAYGRGGATVTSFDLDEARRSGNALANYKLTPGREIEEPISADQMWANHRYFLDAVLPVAEEFGVRLSLHPDDPPVEEPLGGAARIFNSPDGLRRVLAETQECPFWGLTLCLGSLSELAGSETVNEVIDMFGTAGRIFYVHFRDVQGVVPTFRECFLGEGNFDPADVIRRLDAVGFDGFLIDDHVPAMLGDDATWGNTSSTTYCSRGRAHAIGYLHGTLRALGH